MFSVTCQDILPIHPGYAMGNIIKKEDLFLPILQKRLEAYENALVEEIRRKAQMVASDTYKMMQTENQTIARNMMHTASAKINKIKEEHTRVFTNSRD